MAELNPKQRDVPQIGSIPIVHSGVNYSLRAAFLPSSYGEVLTLHIFDDRLHRAGWKKLGITEQVSANISWAMFAPAGGLVLLAAPPGEGATTTDFHYLHRFSSVERKIISIEDFPGYTLGGVTQCYTGKTDGLTFADAFAALPALGADLLFVGDLRDAVRAREAVNAALNGTLVLATIHAPSAHAAWLRLADLGITPEQARRAVRGIAAQRLVRRVCTDCREEYTVPASELADLGYEHGPGQQQEPVMLYQGRGCEKCGNSGYRGRVGVFMWDWLGDAAQPLGTPPFRAAALQAVLEGVTTPDEARRVGLTA